METKGKNHVFTQEETRTCVLVTCNSKLSFSLNGFVDWEGSAGWFLLGSLMWLRAFVGWYYGDLQAQIGWMPKMVPSCLALMLTVSWKLTWDYSLKHFSTACLCGLGFSQHVRWVPRGGILRVSVPKRQKWKPLGQLRAFPINGRALLVLCFTGQGNHKTDLDLKRWRNKLYLLVGEW